MKKGLYVAIILLATAAKLAAQKSEIFTTPHGAVHGYDAVAYFNQNMAVKGLEANKYSWHNADWYFATKENLETFMKDPEKYAPQYGGYCAYGLSEGYKAPTDPQAFTIVDGKLYLNYNLKTRETWSKNREARIEKADKNWPMVKDKE